MLTRQLIVATMQGDAMIPDAAGNINALVQQRIALVTIQLEYQSAGRIQSVGCIHLFFWPAIYCLIVDSKM
jgi:hypothetical protein